MTTLRGMSSAPTPLLAHRDGAWAPLTSADLLPGDLISLKRAERGTESTLVRVRVIGLGLGV